MIIFIWLYAYFHDCNELLHIIFVGYFTTLSIAGTYGTVSNCKVTDWKIIGRKRRGLMEVLSRHLPGRFEGNHGQPQSG
jgi:hypothetical protein